MKVDFLAVEIGSTTTLVNGFDGLSTSHPKWLGQGRALTTVEQGDVHIGVENARADLARKLGSTTIEGELQTLTSSAAGGLRISVHGLAYEMTVRAAKEAALGAGGVLKMVTAGKMGERHREQLQRIRPNLIFLAGGIDYGDEDVPYHNGKFISSFMEEMGWNTPVIYAGNVTLQDEMRALFEQKGLPIFICPNVYPQIDKLEVEGARRIIQNVFEQHIVTAPGMEKVREKWVRTQTSGFLWPTPAAVMQSAQLLFALLGDLVVIDVGGATTDVHSVSEGTPDVQQRLLAPEPKAKRTVEGDLGVYLNAGHIQELIAKENRGAIVPIPQTSAERTETLELAKIAVGTSLKRHAGKFIYRYGPTGRDKLATGKDLTAIRTIIGTGGVFANLDPSGELLKLALEDRGESLLPDYDVDVLIDKHYIMASVGTIAETYPEEAGELLKTSFQREEQ